MRDIFVQFLKDQGCWEEFVDEFDKQSPGISVQDFINGVINEVSKDLSLVHIESILVCAFYFETTESGERFWHKINDKWRKHLGEVGDGNY